MSDPDQLAAEAAAFRAAFAAVVAEVGKVIVGQQEVIRTVITAIFCGGNVLLEGVPGLGKTELVKALGRVLDLDCRRVQFTPDLMPADIIGTTLMTQDESGRYRFEFRQGPVFTQLLLADEINRATPKTQSALLETMQEHAVTVGGTTHRLVEPFFVLATQNPLEQEGTFPLPEAQLDRFLFKVDVRMPSREEMVEVLDRTVLGRRVEPTRVLNGAGILAARNALAKVVVAPVLVDYAVRMVLATHPAGGGNQRVQRLVKWGASPRAAQALLQAGRVAALADGRVHVAAEDLRRYAIEVLQHRLILTYDGLAEGVRTAEIIRELLVEVPESC